MNQLQALQLERDDSSDNMTNRFKGISPDSNESVFYPENQIGAEFDIDRSPAAISAPDDEPCPIGADLASSY